MTHSFDSYSSGKRHTHTESVYIENRNCIEALRCVEMRKNLKVKNQCFKDVLSDFKLIRQWIKLPEKAILLPYRGLRGRVG